MKQNLLALCSFGLVRIERYVSEYCIYCRILSGEKKGGMTVEYASTLTIIPDTESLLVF